MTYKEYRRGFAAVWACLVLLVMIGVVGLSLDWGKLALNVHQMNNAADAAALAGAQVVKYNTAGAIQLAHDIGMQNFAEQKSVVLDTTLQSDPLSGAEEIIIGRWVAQERKFYPTLLAPNAVKAIVKREASLGGRAPALALVFGPIFGTSAVDTDRYAIAWSRASTGSGIICLADDPTIYKDYGWNNGPTGFLINGGCDIDLSYVDPVTGEVTLGDVQVNAVSMEMNTKAGMAKTGTSGTLTMGELNVAGMSSPAPSDSAWADMYADSSLPFSVSTSAPRVEDPLLALNDNPPDISSMPAGAGTDNTTGQPVTYYDRDAQTYETITGGNVTLNPGYYPGGINVSGSAVITLNPGVYAFGGGSGKGGQAAGLVVNTASVLGTEGVEIYITGDPDGSKTGVPAVYGKVDIGGTATVQLTSRGDVSPTDEIGVDGEDGIAIWQDINNHNQATIIGTASSYLKGTLYFPDSPAQVGGGTDQLGAQIICGALQVNGNIDLGIAYDGRNKIKARQSILVE